MRAVPRLMAFTSPTFLFLFLPIVLAGAWISPRRFRRYLLLAAGIVFYAWGVRAFVLVVLGLDARRLGTRTRDAARAASADDTALGPRCS